VRVRGGSAPCMALTSSVAATVTDCPLALLCRAVMLQPGQPSVMIHEAPCSTSYGVMPPVGTGEGDTARQTACLPHHLQLLHVNCHASHTPAHPVVCCAAANTCARVHVQVGQQAAAVQRRWRQALVAVGA
jgi:hypothetical protein